MTFKLAFIIHLLLPVGIMTLFSYTQLLSKYKRVYSVLFYYILLFINYLSLISFVDHILLLILLAFVIQLVLSYTFYRDSYKKVYQIISYSFFIQLLSYILTMIPLSFLFPITPQVTFYFDREFTIYAFLLYDVSYLSLSLYYVLDYSEMKEGITLFKYSTLFICQAIFFYVVVLLSYDLPIYYFTIILLVVVFIIGVSDYVLIKSYKRILLDFLGLVEQTRLKEVVIQEKELKTLKKEICQDIEKIQYLLKKQLDSEAQNYINNKYTELKCMNLDGYSGNKLVDLVIYNKVMIMKEKNIQNTMTISLSQKYNIEDIDLITLLFNILDNSIEACEKVETNRFININIFEKYNCIYIEVVNSKNPNIIFGNQKTTKGDSINHGIGKTIIKNIVSKYHGEVIFEDHKNSFRVKLFLNYM